MDAESYVKSRVSVGTAASAFTASPDGSMLAVIAGHETLRVVRVAESQSTAAPPPLPVDAPPPSPQPPSDCAYVSPRVVRNFRRFRSSHQRLHLSDVSWNPHPSHAHIIATASTDGRLTLWNMEPTTEGARVTLNAHSRAAHRVAWHGSSPTVLLSCSSDGLLKVWDVRQHDRAPAAQYHDALHSSPRDAAFSAGGGAGGSRLAVAFDGGSVQVFDERMSASPSRHAPPPPPSWISRAHVSGALALAWHRQLPGVLATSGRDKTLCVWDTSTGGGDSSSSPALTPPPLPAAADAAPPGGGAAAAVSTSAMAAVYIMSPASRIAWRPVGGSVELATNAAAPMADAVATQLDARVHVWHLARPNLPSRVLLGNASVVTDVSWSPRGDALYTASRSGVVSRLFYGEGRRPYARLPAAALAVERVRGVVARADGRIDRDLGESVGGGGGEAEALLLRSAAPPAEPPELRAAGVDDGGAEASAAREGGGEAAAAVGVIKLHRLDGDGFSASTAAATAAPAARFGVNVRALRELMRTYVWQSGGGGAAEVAEVCESNVRAAEFAGSAAASATWEMLAAVQRETEAAAAVSARGGGLAVLRGVASDAIAALSRDGDFQSAACIASVLRNQLVANSERQPAHVTRSACAYIDTVRRLGLHAEARRVADLFGVPVADLRVVGGLRVRRDSSARLGGHRSTLSSVAF